MNSLKTCPLFILIVLTCFSALNCANKLDQIDFQPTGAITGCIYELGTPNAIEGAIILLEGREQPWAEAATATTGQFLMLGVPAGVYNVRVNALRFHKQSILRVRVAPDSISIVAIRLTNTELDVTPDPIWWAESKATLGELRALTQSGKVFESSCK